MKRFLKWIGITNWIDEHIVSVLARRVAAIVTAQEKKTRKEIKRLRDELLEELNQLRRPG